ncbi:MAG: sulfatase-like hydrolase/transferase, partial [Myxococcota bacterium]
MSVWLACRPAEVPVRPAPSPTPPSPRDSGTPYVPGPLRNVLMISIDTTRRDHVDRYATDGEVRTPFLASLLATGVAFDDHQQCSDWTYGSTTCTLEGRLNEDTGWLADLNADRTPIPLGRRTLAARLGELGWHSMLVSSNDWLSDSWNNAQGYDQFQRESTDDTAALLASGLSTGPNLATAIDPIVGPGGGSILDPYESLPASRGATLNERLLVVMRRARASFVRHLLE